MSQLSVLKQLKKDGSEDIIAIIIDNRISIEDLANILRVSQELMHSVITKKDIKVHKISDRLVSRWMVDLEDFWKKT